MPEYVGTKVIDHMGETAFSAMGYVGHCTLYA